MNCRGDEYIDAKRSRPSIGKPVMGHARKERVVLFGTDQRITSGPAAKRPHSKAEYMTAPERFADSQIPLAPRAPSIHDPYETFRRPPFKRHLRGRWMRPDTSRSARLPISDYCAATALEDWKAENLKLLSFGSSGRASKRRAAVIARGEPCREIFPLSSAAASPAYPSHTLVKAARSAAMTTSTGLAGALRQTSISSRLN